MTIKLWRKVNLSTFESTDTKNVLAMVEGNISGKDVSITFDDPVTQHANIAGIKGLFSDANSDTFLSAMAFVSTFMLTRSNPDNPDDLDDRLPLSDAEIDSLKFSYIWEKDNGTDESPVVTWQDCLDKLAVAQTFDMVKTAQRKRRSTQKVINTAW